MACMTAQTAMPLHVDTDRTPERLSVVVPAFNPGTAILGVLASLDRVAVALAVDMEVIVVCDGSTDHSTEALPPLAYAALRTARHLVNQGKGAALRTGFALATGTVVGFVDADGDIDPEVIGRMWTHLQCTGADAVIGARFGAGAEGDCYGSSRQIASRVFSWWVSCWLRLPSYPTQVGVKMFRGAALAEALPLTRETGFAFDVDLLSALWHLAYRNVDTIGIKLSPSSASSVTLRRGLGAFLAVLRIATSRARFRPHPAMTVATAASVSAP